MDTKFTTKVSNSTVTFILPPASGVTLESLLIWSLKSSFLVSTGLEMTSSKWTAIVGSSGALEDSAIHVNLVVFLKSCEGKKWHLHL